MRVLVLATMLLASSSLCAFAQEPGKAPAEAPQAGTDARTNPDSPPPRDQKAGRDQPKAEDREMGPDWKLRRSERDRVDRDDREKGHGGMMRRGDGDRMDRDHDKQRGRYQERGDRDRERADGDDRGYSDVERLRRRVKICFEFENGDEFCRYKR